MTKETKKAKDILTDRPFRIIYFREDDNILYKEDYPSYIPNKGDTIILDGKRYVVIGRTFSPEENNVHIYVNDYNTISTEMMKEMKPPMPTPYKGSL